MTQDLLDDKVAEEAEIEDELEEEDESEMTEEKDAANKNKRSNEFTLKRSKKSKRINN